MAPGDHFQDEEDVVYQKDRQEWIKVKVKPFVINRTRRPGERNGDLSLTAARELGYIVEGEGKKEPKKPKVKEESGSDEMVLGTLSPNTPTPESIAEFVNEIKGRWPEAELLLTGIHSEADNGRALAAVLPLFRTGSSMLTDQENRFLGYMVPLIEGFEEKEYPL